MFRIVAIIVFIFAIQGEAKKTNSPISLSFVSLKKCFPDLAGAEFEAGIGLDELKEKIDQKYLTTKSNLRFRKLTLWDGHDLKRLTIRATETDPKIFEYEMLLEKIDDKNVATEVELPAKHRKNPTQGDINIYTINNEVRIDETSYLDTKLNGMVLSFKKNFKRVEELELKDLRGPRTLTCENQKNLGVVCTCK